MLVGEFWVGVTALCHLFDARITSGPRSIDWNAKVGGLPTSMHLVGLGADMAGVHPDQFPAVKTMAQRIGILALDESYHIHLQPLDANPT